MILITALEIIYAFGLLLVACELGQRVNCAFEECNEMIVQFKWYLFSTEPQRLLPIIIHFAQQSVDIKCFGSAACDRETFKYVSIIEWTHQVQPIITFFLFFLQKKLIIGDQDGIFLFYGSS